MVFIRTSKLFAYPYEPNPDTVRNLEAAGINRQYPPIKENQRIYFKRCGRATDDGFWNLYKFWYVEVRMNIDIDAGRANKEFHKLAGSTIVPEIRTLKMVRQEGRFVFSLE